MDGAKGAGIGWCFEVGDVRGPVFGGAAGGTGLSWHRWRDTKMWLVIVAEDMW